MASQRGQAGRSPRTLDTRHGPIVFGPRCLVMGILNVTPDSFSDGGLYLDAGAAAARALEMAEEGADVIDIGGESTRPGSDPVPAEEQIRRVRPVIAELRSRGVTLPVSIDTRSAKVAQAALDAGADVVNDVSAARDDAAMPELLACEKVPFVAMHMQGTPKTMQVAPRYDDVVEEVAAFFDERAAALERVGVDTSRMIVDPGIGFGKTLEHNLAILGNLRRFAGRWPLLVGPSRKRFIGELLSPSVASLTSPPSDLRPPASDILAGTLAVVLHCALCGVDMVRVHDVARARAIVDVCG